MMKDNIPILETKVEEFILNGSDLKDVHAITILILNDKKLIVSFAGKKRSEPGGLEENNSIWCCFGLKKNIQYQWTTPQRIVSPQYFQDHHIPLKKDNGVISCANPVLTLFDNQLLIFSKIGSYPRTWSGILSRSYDQGLTWKEPKILHGILGPTRNKPLILQNSILSPSSRESCIDDFPYVESSSDLRTWNISNPILSHNRQIFQEGYRGFIQPTLISLTKACHKVIMLVRPRNTNPLLSKLHIHRSISMNKGKNWSNLQPTDLLNPDSAIDAINLGNKTILLAYNRVVTYSKSRNILSLAISFNEGVNWHPIGIKDSIFPKGDMEYSKLTSQEYSYPAIIMDIYSKEIHVAYTFNRINFKHKVFKLLQN
ncbi:MAG: exo-alpha-sialidase [Rickettsia endosymbiont of Labidopullus appendiculatus]|nr:exo-alpha-sialidase [Rickettsia endosymbiont of Labidopullus appendiculatus]